MIPSVLRRKPILPGVLFMLLGFLIPLCINASPKETSIWVVRTDGTQLDAGFFEETRSFDKGPLPGLEGFFRIDFKKSPLKAEEINELLEANESVLWFEQQFENQIAKPETIPGTPMTDHRFHESWHIANRGQSNGKRGEDLNLLPTWDWGFDGTGVMVAVIDEGVELTHPDLSGNIRHDLALDLVNTPSTNQLETDEFHGTAVSGIIAAKDNEIGSVGVAYGAHLIPIRYLGVHQRDDNVAQALGHQRDFVSIYNNSWGPTLDEDEEFVAMISPSSLGRYSIREGVTTGRGGLGNIFVFAAGNDNAISANVNYNGWANMRETIAVASIGNGGKHVSYSEEGAPLLVCAPSGGQTLGIFTTDRTGALGYDPTDYTSGFSGTSAAAPMVSGVVALMLQSNPQLTWRDVQHILVKTAVQVDDADGDWQINGSGLPVNHKYGFGRVDASSAIQTAMGWQNVGIETSTTFIQSVYTSIPNNDGTILTSSANIARNMKVEHVYITPTINHTDWGDLSIVLRSPSGTESVLATPHEDETGTYGSWTYTSARCWDEESEGIWTLEIRDAGTAGTGILNRWTITIYGTEIDDQRNNAPVALPDEYISSNYPLTMPVLANDADADGDPLYIISLYQAEFGNLEITPNQELLYTPNDSFLGLDHFGYSVSDARGGTTDTLVQITHPGPVPRPDQAVVEMNRSVSIPVLANDFDRSGDPIELVSVDQPEEGTVVIEDDRVIYTPSADFVGLETYAYTITDNVDGEKQGTIKTYVSASNDFALLFDGIDDYVRVVPSAGLNITQTITMEARIYLRSYGEYGDPGFGRILDRNTYSMLVNGTKHTVYPDHCLVVAFDLPGGTTATVNSVGNTISLNQWHTVSATYDGTEVRMYVDGRSVEVQNQFAILSGPISLNPVADLYIGESASQERAFDGIIDWVRLWDVIRPSEKLLSANTFIPSNDRNGLVGWWQFNEGVDDIANDSAAGNTNHGLVSEALWIPTDPSLLSKALE